MEKRCIGVTGLKNHITQAAVWVYWPLSVTFTMKSGAQNRMARLRILAFWPDWKTGIQQA
jgi:hypothetical protein